MEGPDDHIMFVINNGTKKNSGTKKECSMII